MSKAAPRTTGTRDQSVCAPSQWETTLQCNVVSHWLAANTKWSLNRHWKRHVILTKFSSLVATDVNVSFWHNFYHWLHWPLSKWQCLVQAAMKILSKWWHFCFRCVGTIYEVYPMNLNLLYFILLGLNYQLLLNYCQVSNIRRTVAGNKIVDHSDVVGASPVGAAPTTSSFST